jgi:hypothetical protein
MAYNGRLCDGGLVLTRSSDTGGGESSMQERSIGVAVVFEEDSNEIDIRLVANTINDSHLQPCYHHHAPLLSVHALSTL